MSAPEVASFFSSVCHLNKQNDENLLSEFDVEELISYRSSKFSDYFAGCVSVIACNELAVFQFFFFPFFRGL